MIHHYFCTFLYDHFCTYLLYHLYISMRKIECIMHVSRHTISVIYKAADVHSVSWDNVKYFDEDKIYYKMLFPPTTKTSVFE